MVVCHNCGYGFEPGSAGVCCRNPNKHYHDLAHPCDHCLHLTEKPMKPDLFLRNGGTIADLEALHVLIKRHPVYSGLFLAKYDQIESPMDNKVVQGCRGIIIDEDGFRCVARPFDKFFNEGESQAAKIDWKAARVQEKLDGSLMIMYWHDNQWQVATSGTPDAGGEVNGYGFTFRELFWKTMNEQPVHIDGNIIDDGRGVGCMGVDTTLWEAFKLLGDKYDLKRFTWMWELTSPYNRIVVQHKEPRLTLIGVRNVETGVEIPVSKIHGLNYGIPVVREFPLSNLEEIAATFPSMEPTTQEGYVVVDAEFNRVKVKNPAYVALHHARDGFGLRRMLEIARGGEVGEWLAYFPEFKDDFEAVKSKLDALVATLETAYELHKDKADQKEFALAVKDLPCSGALFSLRRGKVASIREFLATMNIASLMDYLHLKDRKIEVAA